MALNECNVQPCREPSSRKGWILDSTLSSAFLKNPALMFLFTTLYGLTILPMEIWQIFELSCGIISSPSRAARLDVDKLDDLPSGVSMTGATD